VKVTAAIENPGDVRMTVAFTMSVTQWQSLCRQLGSGHSVWDNGLDLPVGIQGRCEWVLARREALIKIGSKIQAAIAMVERYQLAKKEL
jgi:hypothetical protein